MSKTTFGKPCKYWPEVVCELKTLNCPWCVFYADYVKHQNEINKGGIPNNGGKG